MYVCMYVCTYVKLHQACEVLSCCPGLQSMAEDPHGQEGRGSSHHPDVTQRQLDVSVVKVSVGQWRYLKFS